MSIAGSTPGILGGAGTVTGEQVGDGLAEWIDADPANGPSLRDAIAAVPTSRIVGGLDLSADRSATDVLASLQARILAPDTGWTDFTTGVGPSITHASGVHTLNTTSNSFAWMRRTAISTPEAPSVEIMGRFNVTTGNPATAWYTALGLTNGADDRGYLAQVSETGSLGIWLNSGSGYTLVSGSGAISRTSGVWVRLIVTPAYVSAAWGTTGTSTPPTSWTVTASAATNVGVLASGQLLRHGIRSGRTASGSGTYTVEWTDVQYRILGVAP